MNGWIKLWRKFLEWEWYHQSDMVHLFIHLLLMANYEPSKWQGVDVSRGQLVTGRKALSTDTGISEQTIRTCLTKLKSTSELTIKSTNKFSIITLCNYEAYQIELDNINQHINQQPNQQLTNNQPTTNHIQEVKEYKNIRRKNNTMFIKPSLEEVKQYCKERNKGIDPDAWYDHHLRNGWRVGKPPGYPMKDWKATIRTWERNDFNKISSDNSKPKQFLDTSGDPWKEEMEKYKRGEL